MAALEELLAAFEDEVVGHPGEVGVPKTGQKISFTVELAFRLWVEVEVLFEGDLDLKSLVKG